MLESDVLWKKDKVEQGKGLGVSGGELQLLFFLLE